MALGIRYSGSFLSINGTVWRVDILQKGYGGTQAGELSFPADCPLEFSWANTDKIEPVQSSSATLKIISDSDRRFVDFYVVEVGAVRMDVYRDGDLYWSGTLDTELYEEPYTTAEGYNVTLTFSDFAPLGRRDWNGTGMIRLYDLIMECLSMTGINYKDIDYTKVSTTAGNLEKVTGEVYVLQENFYDEDGEAMTVREVLEDVLRPFALRIIQKGGIIWLYDLNGLSTKASEEVQWYADDAVLSADVIYNNVKVTFSPYASAQMMRGEVADDASLTADTGGQLVRVNYERDKAGALKAMEGFRFHTKDEADSNMTVSGGAKFFQTRAIYSGQDETGVAATMKTGDYAVSKDGGESSQCSHTLLIPQDCGTIDKGDMNTSTIITCPKVYLGNVSLKGNFFLRLSLRLLFDVRYNPFESEGNYNDNAGWRDGFLNLDKHDGPYQNMLDWCNYGYVPIKLSLLDTDGTVLYHYENRVIMEGSGFDRLQAQWVKGAASWGQAYLCYYDIDDRKSKTGFGGWQTNKQIIGYYRDELPSYLKTIEDGEYVSLPPTGGYLQLEIGSGVHQFDYKREVRNIYKYCRWILYKEPTITLCKRNYTEADMEDVEDSAWLNKAAKEQLSIDTIIGSTPQKFGIPNGRGQIFDADGGVISKFYRGGAYDRLERLLIGTVYSQYATRHDTLSGTVKLLPSFGVYADQNGNTAGKFLLLSETQDVRMDESTILMAEFSADSYEGIEYE